MGFVGVVVNRLAFVAEVPPEDAVPTHMRAEWGVGLAALDVRYEMDTWWDNVRTWLEISTGQRLTQVGHQQPPAWDLDSRTQIWLVSKRTKRERWRGGGDAIGPERPPVHGVDADVFAACAALSDIGPPLAWNLLRDARALQGVGQYRRALIDAATAAELAVIELLDERLQDTELDIQKVLLDDNPMLGRKARLLARLGNALPKSFTDDLVTKRNQAVHKGVDPTWDECEAAIQAALVQVKKMFPLPISPASGAPLVCRW